MSQRATPEDVVYTPEVSGLPASLLRESLEAWKDVWSAEQAAGLVERSASCREIVEELVADYEAARRNLPDLAPAPN